jgi:hypothetical protein
MDKLIKLRGRRTIIGRRGTVRIYGPHVAPRHAEVKTYATADGPLTAIRSIEGPVSVDRRGVVWPVTAPWPLADGDVIIIGDHRLTYRDLGSPMNRDVGHEVKEVANWLL